MKTIVSFQVVQDNAVVDPSSDVTTYRTHFVADDRLKLIPAIEPVTKVPGILMQGTKRRVFVPWSNVRAAIVE